MPVFAVLHIPHSSTAIPADVRPRLLVDDAALAHELLVMTDWFTDGLFALDAETASTVRFAVSRLVVDPERFLDDDKEPMAARGMGAIYTRRADGGPLRAPPGAIERSGLIMRFYVPHHSSLAGAVRGALDEHGRSLVIDCHSFASHPLPCDPDQSEDRPDICIGTD